MGKKLIPIRKVELQNEDDTPRWYVMTVQYQEKYATDLMKRVKNMGLSEYILETFTPTRVYEEVVNVNGKTKKFKRKEPIWPTNYILIRMLMNSQTWSLCRNTTYSMGWLNADGHPKEIKEVEVAELKERCGAMETIKKEAKVNFKGSVNDRVVIVNHMFVGKTGTINVIENDNITVTLDNGFKIQVEPYQVKLEDTDGEGNGKEDIGRG